MRLIHNVDSSLQVVATTRELCKCKFKKSTFDGAKDCLGQIIIMYCNPMRFLPIDSMGERPNNKMQSFTISP